MTRATLIFILPNLISTARLLAVPLLVWLLLGGRFTEAFWLFIAAGISDALDGFIAKSYDVRTTLGAYLDPLADKSLLVSVYITLGYQGSIDSWLVILVVFRDLLIIGGALLYHTLTQSLKMQPLFISKLNTTAQILLVTVLLANLGLGIDDYGLGPLLIHVVAATTFLSGAAYLVIWGWRIGRMENL
ncbi:CDP-alcohol phosphatidyltransferase family protein [Virgifigura deserti]|uniref:CDP-alcohol phosphatidyltransferase family protein n=1 Tax=Virgifigura deserti TaxID=2268457 RepID=UPI003CCB9B85